MTTIAVKGAALVEVLAVVMLWVTTAPVLEVRDLITLLDSCSRRRTAYTAALRAPTGRWW